MSGLSTGRWAAHLGTLDRSVSTQDNEEGASQSRLTLPQVTPWDVSDVRLIHAEFTIGAKIEDCLCAFFPGTFLRGYKMARSSLFLFAAAATLVLAACTEHEPESTTGPEFAASTDPCGFSNSLVSGYFPGSRQSYMLTVKSSMASRCRLAKANLRVPNDGFDRFCLPKYRLFDRSRRGSPAYDRDHWLHLPRQQLHLSNQRAQRLHQSAEQRGGWCLLRSRRVRPGRSATILGNNDST